MGSVPWYMAQVPQEELSRRGTGATRASLTPCFFSALQVRKAARWVWKVAIYCSITW